MNTNDKELKAFELFKEYKAICEDILPKLQKMNNLKIQIDALHSINKPLTDQLLDHSFKLEKEIEFYQDQIGTKIDAAQVQHYHDTVNKGLI